MAAQMGMCLCLCFCCLAAASLCILCHREIKRLNAHTETMCVCDDTNKNSQRFVFCFPTFFIIFHHFLSKFSPNTFIIPNCVLPLLPTHFSHACGVSGRDMTRNNSISFCQGTSFDEILGLADASTQEDTQDDSGVPRCRNHLSHNHELHLTNVVWHARRSRRFLLSRQKQQPRCSRNQPSNKKDSTKSIVGEAYLKVSSFAEKNITQRHV